MQHHLANLYWLTISDLIPIVNPIAVGLFFLSFTQGSAHKQVNKSAYNLGLYMIIALAITLLMGTFILHFFGISLPYVRIAGGLLVFSIGWKMLNGNQSNVESSPRGIHKALFYPVTMPFTVGGGTLAATMTLATYVDQHSVKSFILGNLVVLLGILTVAILVTLCCRFANKLKRFLGEGGVQTILFVFALILLPLSLTIVWAGVSALIQKL